MLPIMEYKTVLKRLTAWSYSSTSFQSTVSRSPVRIIDQYRQDVISSTTCAVELVVRVKSQPCGDVHGSYGNGQVRFPLGNRSLISVLEEDVKQSEKGLEPECCMYTCRR